jgi:type 2 lantibiotic biosynthesis protein LanM
MISNSLSWYEALTLTERLDSLRALRPSQTALPCTLQIMPQIDAVRANRLLNRWRAQAPFDKEAVFLQRLRLDGITEDELKYLLGETVESLRERWRIPPYWLQQLSEAYSRTKEGGKLEGEAEKRFFADTSTKAGNNNGLNGFLFLIQPLLDHALARFRVGILDIIRERRTIPFDPKTVEALFLPGLLRMLSIILTRTLILELNVARLRGQLIGDTPEARFHSFVEGLRVTERALALLEEYPVMARQLTQRIDSWFEYCLEFLTHLCNDWEAIQATFGSAQNPEVLTEIDSSKGDAHRRGRSVLIATFCSGLKIVYKPRSLAVDLHFQGLLEWMNEQGWAPPFLPIKALDRGTYGWQEFVAAKSCASRAEVERFYQRQGGYLALLHALQATDLHQENLIASGEHPFLVDLESLFHPDTCYAAGSESEVLADVSLDRSVLRVGLLPGQGWINDEGEGVDFSGMGGNPGQLTPFEVPYWDEAGTDMMRMSRQRVALPAGQNRPALNAEDINLLEFSESIIDGFKSVYRILKNHRHELIADNGPLSCFAADEVRVILRPTRTYGQLLHESYHPSLLRNGLDRERYFDQLWIAAEQRPELAHVIADERRDLQEGDIPLFTTRVSVLDLWNSAGRLIPGWIRESGMSRARERISEFSEEDLDRQVWFIRASMATQSSFAQDGMHPSRPTASTTGIQDSPGRPSQPGEVSRESLLRMACRIGDRLENTALRDKDNATWIGLTLINERTWSLQPLGIDLYSGLPGVILYLACLGKLTGEDRYDALARAGFKSFERQIEKLRSSMISIGGFSGWGGVIYSLTRLGAIWHEPVLYEKTEEVVNLVCNLIDQDKDYDVIDGSAGCIGALLSFYKSTGSPKAMSVAAQCGDRLIQCSKPMKSGLGWCGRGTVERPLTGFSHGTAGIAWALLKLAALTDVDRYRSAALGAIEYERSLFSPTGEGWPDLRQHESPDPSLQNEQVYFRTAWCHGAAGIGLGRLDSLAENDNEETRAEIGASLKLTLAGGFGRNHSLCHGDLGNLDLLVQAEAKLGETSLKVEIERLSAIILEEMEHSGTISGMINGVETPGLMAGLAGIGYGLLRLTERSRLPSVLTLSPLIEENI